MPTCNVLFCYSRIPHFTNAVTDYAQSFMSHSRHRIHYVDLEAGPFLIDLNVFDAIIVSYCFWARCIPLSKSMSASLTAFAGPKIAILQDEYDMVPRHQETLLRLGFNTIVTCVPEKHWRDVYQDPRFRSTTFIQSLTGYVPDRLLDLPIWRPMRERRWILGYRGRPVPFKYGRLTREKQIIGERMRDICAARNIAANIEVSEEGRIYGAAWPAFLRDCRAVLGTESGSNVFDPEGNITRRIEGYIAENPNADFETVHRLHLADIDGHIEMNQISPRIFEAIACGTGLVLFDGRYSDVIKAGIHYIPLRKDFSNVDEVFAALQDDERMEAMVSRAHTDIVSSGEWSFARLVTSIDAHISRAVPSPNGIDLVYGVIGWRRPGHSVEFHLPHASTIPTSTTLHHDDTPIVPIMHLSVSVAILRTRMTGAYSAIMGTRLAQWAHRIVASWGPVYHPLRRIVRRLTDRT